MHLISSHPRTTLGLVFGLLFFWLILLYEVPLQAQQAALLRQSGHALPLTVDHQRILDRAREILQKTAVTVAEREVRLQVLKAVLTGTVIRPDDDYPEMRNPKHWILSNDTFVVAPGSTPIEAIADLWVAHENDGVPIPRIRCYKYSSLTLIEGFIQYFRETGNAAGLAALNRLLADRIIPQGLPNHGNDLLWKNHPPSGRLLPGDQVWFDNPFFDRGRELIRREAYDQAVREGKSPAAATAAGNATTESLIAGEEGSNVFCLGDDKFIRGAHSLSRLCRDSFQAGDNGTARAHEQVLTPTTLTLSRFQEHMIDDNYTAQACLRADPSSIHPEDFKIERVRSPLGPVNLLRLYGGSTPCTSPDMPPKANAQESKKPIPDALIDAMVSRNKPPRLVTSGDATVPLFDADYNWSEQQRVRTAIDAVMRIKSDDFWWRLRDHVRDDRYVLTAVRGRVVKNFTVGALCGDIVDLRLCLGFTAHLPSVPGRLPATFRPEREYWERESQWAGQRMPLHAMQSALCARALQQWKSVRSTLPDGNGQTHTYTADESSRYMAALKKEIATLNSTKKARFEEVVVPWLPAPGGWEGFDAQRAREMKEAHLRKVAESH
jgi:hypothetical protein